MSNSDRPPAEATRAEVDLVHARAMTRSLMRAQFVRRGGVPHAVLERIEACDDLTKLEAAREQLDQISCPEELKL